MLTPQREGRAHFLAERVPLIDADDAAETAADVIEAPFDHVERRAQPGHATGHAAADVVDDPGRQGRGGGVARALR